MTTNRRRVVVMAHQIAFYASLLFVIFALTQFEQTNGDVINDLNNMLRDATATETDTAAPIDAAVASDGGVRIGNSNNKLENVATHQMLRNSERKRNKKNHLKNKHDIELNRISMENVNENDDDNVVDDIDVDMSDSDDNDDVVVGSSSSSSDEMMHETSVELLRFVNDDDKNNNNNNNANDINENLSKSSSSLSSYVTPSSNVIRTDTGSSSSDTTTTKMSLEDQVHLLTKQLNALMTRRREDYEILERNLRKSLRITTKTETVDMDIRNEIEQLRLEVKSLSDNGQQQQQHASHNNNNNNKERLTIEWLQQSVAELRKQLSELQQMANNAAKDLRQRKESYEDLATIRNDFQQLKLELIAIKERQAKTDAYVRELREEVLQQEEDTRRMLHNLQHLKKRENSNEDEIVNSNDESTESELTTVLPTADHKRRHCRFQRQQIHELQLTQRRMKHQLEELKFHRIGERVRSIEIEQHRIADANFNLSRQIASLDKLHSSMLELLEDVEGLQNKMDKNIPELRHEISKLEFSNAQLNSEQNLVREEGKNVARSVQAMAVSVSTLQDEREGVKQMQNTVRQLQTNVDRMESMMHDVQHALSHRHKGAMHEYQHATNSKSNQQQQQQQQHKGHNHQHHHQHEQQQQQQRTNNIYKADAAGNEMLPTNNNDHIDYTPMSQRAESLVAKLENVEQQYESIINKLPQDCSEVSNVGSSSNSNGDGLYMIAPAGQHRPLMAHCSSDGWTTIQRRYDGSADFNRSWEDYASGFGAPIGEYWIGNEQLHHLTLSNCTSLRVIMQDIYDNTWLAEYSYFYISSRADGYRLHVGGYHGNASDALDYQQGMQFSAIDVDRDISQTHCAANYEGGWWFSHCQHANLNGRYNLGLTWFDASRNEWIAVKSSQMLIKRHQTSSSKWCSGILEDVDNTSSSSSSSGSSVTSATTIISNNVAATSTQTTTLATSSV